MKKVLIWYNWTLKNTGGPKGYLYNIREALRSNKDYNIVFLSDIITPFEEKNKSVNTKKHKFIYDFLRDLKHIYTLCWGYFHHKPLQLPNGFRINEYDFVHVHSIYDVFTFRTTFPNYKGKVILTTHCPCPWTDEMLSHEDKFVNLFRPFILYWECKAYKKADYLMFPCKDARDPYEKEPRIKKLFTNNEDKFFYVPSAIMDIKINKSSMQTFKDIGIPDGSFVISYFGRHNRIKGYDILKQVGQALLEKYPNLYFICGGRGDITPLRHKRWIELGFINNTHELLLQTDLYISANRETYFDLIILEILRSGTKLILSETGGNKFFKCLPAEQKDGLLFYKDENLQELIELVESCIKKKTESSSMYERDCMANRNLYLQKFTLDTYLKRYTDEINSL